MLLLKKLLIYSWEEATQLDLQAYRLTGLQAYRLTGLQAYRLTGLQARLVMTIVLMKNNRMFKVNRVFCFPIETKAPIR